MNLIKNKLKLDNKILIYFLIFNLSIFIYGIVRIFFITNTNDLFALTEGSTYIMLIQEIFLLVIVSPAIFLYKNSKERNDSYLTVMLYALFISLIFCLITLIAMPSIVNAMLSLNTWATKGELYWFVISSMIGYVFIIFMYVYVTIFMSEKDYNAILILMLTQMFIMIFYDVIFLSDLIFLKQTLFGVTMANILGPMCAALFGFIWLSKKYKFNYKAYKKVKINRQENNKYFKQGAFIFGEGMIRQLAYLFITLSIMNNLGKEEWSSWNLSMNLFFGLFIKFSFAIQVASYAKYSENKIHKNEILESGLIYTLIFVIILSILSYPLIEIFLPWNANNQSFVPLAMQTSWNMMPIIFIVMFAQPFVAYFNANGLAKYYFYNQILLLLILNLPILIMLKTNYIVGTYYIASLMFGLSCIITLVSYSFMFFYTSWKVERIRVLERVGF